MDVYFNEFDPFAAAWLRELAAAGRVSPGVVDERSIRDVSADDVRGYRRAHWFAGIGGWEEALRLAGFPEGRDVWTGSCPCQPFSSAGKRKGEADERHLWPEFFRLIRECRPQCVFGEQVEGAVRLGWLDGVFADLEGEGYTCGAAVLGAHSVGAPHIRQRLYWVAHTRGKRAGRDAGTAPCPEGSVPSSGRPDGGVGGNLALAGGPTRRLADAAGVRHRGSEAGQGAGRDADALLPMEPQGCGPTRGVEHTAGDGREQWRPEPVGRGVAGGRGVGGVGHADDAGREGRGVSGGERPGERAARAAGGEAGFAAWDRFDLIPCRDGRSRRVEPGSFPLVDGASRSVVRGSDPGSPVDAQRSAEARTGRLRGYGNAIVPQVAAIFIRAFLEAERDLAREVPR